MTARAMNLRELLGEPSAPRLRVSGLASDSRRVRPGDVFFAYRGRAFDGHDFAADAVAAGAVAVVSERPLNLGVANVVVNGVAERLGAWSRRFFGAPSAELDVVGVTGTNGKTTVAYNIAQIASGGYVGTLGWGRVPQLCRSDLTTADPISLQAQLRALRDRGQRVVALEASSHALDQGRVDAVDFSVGVFTNLGRDHLDYHGTLARYASAKRRLFERDLRIAVVNGDDALGRAIADAAVPRRETFAFGRSGAVRWERLEYAADGIRGLWTTPWGRAAFALPGFFGEFSVYNAAAALATCCALELMPFADVVDAMAQLPGVPGRMQRVADAPLVLVDYAHTPDGLRAVLAAARAHGAARTIVVFGCGGDRDRGKRRQMARAAEDNADVVVATTDNPRSEEPNHILDDVMAGFRNPGAARRVVDRREAIAMALDLAGADDLVLVAGKGHEERQIVGDRTIPFNDAQTVRALLGAAPPGAPGGATAAASTGARLAQGAS